MDRKPSAKWVKDGSSMAMTAGVFELSAWWVGTKHRWRVMSERGDNLHDSGVARGLEDSQLAAEDALRALLTDALKELG